MPYAKKIAVIGAGGKTTTIARLAARLRDQRVLLTTTTHIFPFSAPDCDRICISPTPEALHTALSTSGIVCAGTAADHGKLSALSSDLFSFAEQYADWILYEADGSRHLPLKLHAPHEPVILPQTAHCIILAGLSALGNPVCEVVHRYCLCDDWAQSPWRPVDSDIISTCVLDAIAASKMSSDRITVILNQADSSKQITQAQPVLSMLRARGIHCAILSLKPQASPNVPTA